jgi:hypothetical protein
MNSAILSSIEMGKDHVLLLLERTFSPLRIIFQNNNLNLSQKHEEKLKKSCPF